MAKKMVYAVYDSKVNYYHNPMFMMNRGEALRSWETAANDEKLPFAQHPLDFSLCEIGEYDDQTALITPHKAPESLGTAANFKRRSNDTLPLFNSQAN